MATVVVSSNVPTVCITIGLSRSDKVCEDVPIDAVAHYLRSHKECYERTVPTERDSKRIHNRVYIDLDGELPKETTETDFYDRVERIKEALLDYYSEEDWAIKESCKWRCADESGRESHKLSFTLHNKSTAGTKRAIEHYVLKNVYPHLKAALKPIIDLQHVKKKEAKNPMKYEDTLTLDTSVYNNGNRKMRMFGQTKPCQDRPYKIILGSLEDTLITYIPEGTFILPEPQSVLQMAEILEKTEEQPQNVVADAPDAASVSYTDAFTSDPTEDETKSRELMTEVLKTTHKKHYDFYPDWIRIGFIMFNEGFPVEDYIELSKKSKHWQDASPTWIKSKWRLFRKSNLTQALLWKWLSEDDVPKYEELTKRRMDFWQLIKNPSHAETAKFFYNLKPDSYLYNEQLGWFQLMPTNLWKQYDKNKPSGLLSDIFDTFKKLGSELNRQIDVMETDETQVKIMKAKYNALLKFKSKIGMKSFNDGVIAFLPNCYNDDDLDKKMDEHRHLLAFNDAVYDLDKDEVRDIRPDDYCSLSTGYNYPKTRHPEACKELIRTVRSIFEKDEDISTSDEMSPLTTYVLKTLAMSLHGRKKYEKFFLWTGKGGNGKGVLAEMLKRVLGYYHHTIPATCLTKPQNSKDATNPALAKAKGKRACVSTEPEAGDKLQVGCIKEWTGGDEITARDLYHSTVSYVPQFCLYCQCNQIPELSRAEGGIQRRMDITFFPHQFVENPTEPHHKKVNIDLKEKIIKSPQWRDEMFHLLKSAYKLLCKDGLTPPTEVVDASTEYMDSQNPIKTWFEANYEVGLDRNDKRFWIESDKLRKRYETAERNGNPFDKGRFKAGMEALKQECLKKKAFTSMRWVYEKVGDVWTADWRESTGSDGMYWVGIKPKNAKMPCML